MTKTDCAERPRLRDDPRWRCRRASSYGTRCIPSADFERWGCLELDTDATLCAGDGGDYFMTVYLAHGGVSLDCQGQRIDHHYAPGRPSRSAFRTPYARSVSDITLRGCQVHNTGKYGVDLKRHFRGAELAGSMAGHRSIQIEDFTIVGSRRWGVYVGQNSQDVTVRQTRVDGAYGGIYLEAGTERTHIVDGTITGSRVREGIAIDSARDNTVERTLFLGNGDAVNIYRNCGERYGQVCPIARAFDADHNTLRDNVFHGDDVHVAWRQHKLYGIGFCEHLGVLGFFRDRAAHTLVAGNTFRDATLSLRDGPVVVIGNDFEHGAVVNLGTTRPSLARKPRVPVGGVLADNRFADSARIRALGRHDGDGLLAFNNRDRAGACHPGNPCLPGRLRLRVRDEAGGATTSGTGTSTQPAWLELQIPGQSDSRPLSVARVVDGTWVGAPALRLRRDLTRRIAGPRTLRARRLPTGAAPRGPCTGCR